jgi:DNA-binding PadR family transcriptional regulator
MKEMDEIDKARKKFLPMSETMLYMLASFTKPRHGYAVMLFVKEMTKGRIVLGAGTIYQTISKLEQGNLIECIEIIERKNIYQITNLGKILLEDERRRINEIAGNLEVMI